MTDFDGLYPAWTCTTQEAKTIGDRLGVDWKRFPLEELRRGIEVEFEHNSDIVGAARIALEHLMESSTYYTDLDKMEKQEKISSHRKLLLDFLKR
jgi:hypothetical protein